MEKMGKWTPEHDLVWAEMNKKVPTFTAAQKKLVAQPLKGVYFDVQQGRPVFLKYSQAVLVPNLVRNIPELSRLLTKMQNQNIDELITSGGIKVGMHEPTKIHDAQGKLLEDFKLETLQLNNKFWKLQQDLPTKGVKLTDVGSQIQKNIFQALVFNLKDRFILDNNKDYSGDEMIDFLNELTTTMLYKNKDKVYKDLGINQDTGKIENEGLLYGKIIEQLSKRDDISNNIVNGLKMGLSPFGIPGASDLFQNVFSSIINNDLNKIKTNGGGFIQMADFGLSKNEAADKGVKFTSWFLDGVDEKATMPKFEVDKKTGRKKLIPAGIFIPASLISKDIPDYQHYTSAQLFGKYDNKTGEYSGGMIDQAILSNIIGYRIPNQGLVSNDAYRVVGILPEGMGDTVVSYAGITKKTGSDFDIDKLYLMTPSFTFNKQTKKLEYAHPKTDVEGNYLPMNEQSVDALRNLLISSYKNILLQGDPSIMDKVFRPLDMDFFQKDIDNLNEKTDPEAFDSFDPIKDIETKIKFKTSKAGLGVAVNNTMDYVRGAMGDFKLASSLGWGNIEKGITVLDRESSESLSEKDLNNYIEDYNKRVPEDQEIKDIEAFKKEFKSIKIGDTFMALTNAFVDVANNPFIVEGNWVNQTNNLGFMLLRGGVHPFKINAFLNQPIIKDYVSFKNNVESKTVQGTRNPVMNFKIKKIAEKLPSEEQGRVITIGNKSFSPRELFYSLINDLSSIEYVHESSVDLKNPEKVAELERFKKNIDRFKTRLEHTIAQRFQVSIARKDNPNLDKQVKEVTQQLSEVIDDILYVKPVEFEKIDLLNMRKQNTESEMDIAVQESMLAKYLQWTNLAKSLSKGVTASRTDVDGKGKDISSLIVLTNKVREAMTDEKLVGFETKYTRNGKRTSLGSNLDLALIDIDKIMLNNPKFFIPYRKSVVQTFNRVSNEIKGSLLVDDKLANSLVRSYTSYILSGFSPFEMSNQEKNDIVESIPSIIKELQKTYPENPFLNELYLKEAGVIKDDQNNSIGKTFQVGLSNSKKSTTVQNNIVDGFRDLLELDPENAEKIIKYSFLTSGGVKTMSSFFEYIPHEWFNRNRFNQYLNNVIDRDSREKTQAVMDVSFANQYMRHNLNDPFIVETKTITTNEEGIKNINSPTKARERKIGYQSIFSMRGGKDLPPFVTTIEVMTDAMGEVAGVVKLHFQRLAIRELQLGYEGVYVRTTPLGLKHKTGTKIVEFDLNKDGSIDGTMMSAFKENNEGGMVPFNREQIINYIKDNPDNLDYSTSAFGTISYLDEHSTEELEKLNPTVETSHKKVIDTINKGINSETQTNQPSTSVEPTVDTSKEWSGDLKTRPVYTSEGVNTMRTETAKPNEHFGNPFSEAGYGDTRKVPSISTAVQAYKEWLLTGYAQWLDKNGEAEDFAGKQEQRKWILEQINQGKLDGATLLYAGKLAARGQGMHPTALAEVVEELRGPQPSTSVKEGVAEINVDKNLDMSEKSRILQEAKKIYNESDILQDIGSNLETYLEYYLTKRTDLKPEDKYVDRDFFLEFTNEKLEKYDALRKDGYLPEDAINLEYYSAAFTQPYREDASLESLAQVTTEVDKGVVKNIDIRVRPNVTVKEFQDYITGKENTISSKQKEMVFKSLEDNFGYQITEVMKLFSTPEDVKAFLIFHEMSHIEHSDYEKQTEAYKKYTKEYNDESSEMYDAIGTMRDRGQKDFDEKFEKDKAFLPGIISYETRATIDGFEMLKMVQDKYRLALKDFNELSKEEDEIMRITLPRFGMTVAQFKQYLKELGDKKQFTFDFGDNPCK